MTFDTRLQSRHRATVRRREAAGSMLTGEAVRSHSLSTCLPRNHRGKSVVIYFSTVERTFRVRGVYMGESDQDWHRIPGDESDEALFKASLAGDASALEQLAHSALCAARPVVAKYWGSLRNHPSIGDWDDVASEVVACCIGPAGKNLKKLKEKNLRTFLGYVRTASRNRVIDIFRSVEYRVARHTQSGDATPLLDSDAPNFWGMHVVEGENEAERFVREIIDDTIREAMSGALNPKEREATTLWLARVPSRTIAELLGLDSENAANLLLWRARRKMKTYIERSGSLHELP